VHETRWQFAFSRARRKLAEGVRSPKGTASEIADYLKYRCIMARFPVLVADYNLRPISLDVPSGMCSLNPSIIAHQDGWLVFVRARLISMH
jgi:hypothetical protein